MCEVFFLLWIGVPAYLILLGCLFASMPGEALAFAALMLFAVAAAVIVVVLLFVACYVALCLVACCLTCLDYAPDTNPGKYVLNK